MDRQFRLYQSLGSLAINPNRGSDAVRQLRGIQMAISVNAGGRLDRLPISSFHHRIFWLVGAGMLLDGYDLYVFTNVLPAAAQSG